MTETAVSVPPEAQRDDGLVPHSLRQLGWFCNEMAHSGLFKVALGERQYRDITPQEAFAVVQEGLGYGLDPMQSLREISVIVSRGRTTTVVSYKVISARISADPRVELFDWEGDATFCKITAKRRDRTNTVEVVVSADQFTAQERSRHAEHMEDWLYARALRRLSKRGFADLLFGIRLPDEASEIIDVAAVERAADTDGVYGRHDGCGGAWLLRPSNTGGAFLACERCGATSPPPNAIRDALRGRSQEFRLAAPESPQEHLEPGELSRESPEALAPVPEPLSGPDGDAYVPEPIDIPDIDPETVSPPPEEGPEGAQANSGGVSGPEAWRREWIEAILGRAQEMRASPDARFFLKKALEKHAWDGRTPLPGWVAQQPDEVLSDLLTLLRVPEEVVAR